MTTFALFTTVFYPMMGWEISQETLFRFALKKKNHCLEWLSREFYPPFLQRLSREVYPAFLPQRHFSQEKLSSFLEELWRDSPRLAVIQTISAVVLCFLPPLLGFSVKLFPFLSPEAKARFLMNLRQSRWYGARLIFQSLWGFSWIAAFKESSPRRSPFSENKEDLQPSATESKHPIEHCDYLIVGSGAAGATIARELARLNYRVIVLEEGQDYRQKDFEKSLYDAMRHLFRDNGISAMRGRSLIPLLQGRVVGGSTVINGAIAHPFPKAVYDEWAKDAAIQNSFSFDELSYHSQKLWDDLSITRNETDTASPLLNALEKLGWNHIATARAAPNCRASGRCLQGCPTGSKLSMERQFIPEASALGATLLKGHRAHEILWDGDKAKGVIAASGSGLKNLLASRGVILAAGALESPAILMRSSLSSKRLGKQFRCHLSVSVSALLSRPALEVEGIPQRREILEFSSRGIKLSSQLVPDEILFSRLPSIGQSCEKYLNQKKHLTSWVATVASDSEGEIHLDSRGKPWVSFEPSSTDLQKLKEGIFALSKLLFEIGAEEVFPPLTLGPFLWKDPKAMKSLEKTGLDPRNFFITTTHLFGGCRMGGDPTTSVVSPHFQVHGTENLFVVDASVFPTTTGVNPQHSIMTVSRLAVDHLIKEPSWHLS